MCVYTEEGKNNGHIWFNQFGVVWILFLFSEYNKCNFKGQLYQDLCKLPRPVPTQRKNSNVQPLVLSFLELADLTSCSAYFGRKYGERGVIYLNPEWVILIESIRSLLPSWNNIASQALWSFDMLGKKWKRLLGPSLLTLALTCSNIEGVELCG